MSTKDNNQTDVVDEFNNRLYSKLKSGLIKFFSVVGVVETVKLFQDVFGTFDGLIGFMFGVAITFVGILFFFIGMNM